MNRVSTIINIIKLLLCGIVAIILIVYLGGAVLRYTSHDYWTLSSIDIGMAEDSLIIKLGRPAIVYYAHEVVDKPEYYVEGYQRKEREITNKVYIYFKGVDLIAYIYIDANNRVEDIFIGGS